MHFFGTIRSMLRLSGVLFAVPRARVCEETSEGRHQCELHHSWLHQDRGMGECIQGAHYKSSATSVICQLPVLPAA